MSAVQESDYCFVVVEEPTGQSAVVEFRTYDDVAKQHLQSVWQRLHTALQGHHKICKRPTPSWTAWKPWDWCEEKKQGYEGRIKYIAWCGDIPVGFLNVWADFASVHSPGKLVLYLEHLAASPGNLPTELWTRRFKAVGSALFAFAVLLSCRSGFEGRLGLHVADSEALLFYQTLNRNCGQSLFHLDQTGVAGPTPRGMHEMGKVYLETIESGAMAWLEGYRRA